MKKIKLCSIALILLALSISLVSLIACSGCEEEVYYDDYEILATVQNLQISYLTNDFLTLSWDAVENSSSYAVIIVSGDDTYTINNIDTTSLVLTSYLFHGINNIFVRANGTGLFRNSDLSDSQTISFASRLNKIEKIYIYLDRGLTMPTYDLVWDIIAGADTYLVYLYNAGEWKQLLTDAILIRETEREVKGGEFETVEGRGLDLLWADAAKYLTEGEHIFKIYAINTLPMQGTDGEGHFWCIPAAHRSATYYTLTVKNQQLDAATNFILCPIYRFIGWDKPAGSYSYIYINRPSTPSGVFLNYRGYNEAGEAYANHVNYADIFNIAVLGINDIGSYILRVLIKADGRTRIGRGEYENGVWTRLGDSMPSDFAFVIAEGADTLPGNISIHRNVDPANTVGWSFDGNRHAYAIYIQRRGETEKEFVTMLGGGFLGDWVYCDDEGWIIDPRGWEVQPFAQVLFSTFRPPFNPGDTMIVYALAFAIEGNVITVNRSAPSSFGSEADFVQISDGTFEFNRFQFLGDVFWQYFTSRYYTLYCRYDKIFFFFQRFLQMADLAPQLGITDDMAFDMALFMFDAYHGSEFTITGNTIEWSIYGIGADQGFPRTTSFVLMPHTQIGVYRLIFDDSSFLNSLLFDWSGLVLVWDSVNDVLFFVGGYAFINDYRIVFAREGTPKPVPPLNLPTSLMMLARVFYGFGAAGYDISEIEIGVMGHFRQWLNQIINLVYNDDEIKDGIRQIINDHRLAFSLANSTQAIQHFVNYRFDIYASLNFEFCSKNTISITQGNSAAIILEFDLYSVGDGVYRLDIVDGQLPFGIYRLYFDSVLSVFDQVFFGVQRRILALIVHCEIVSYTLTFVARTEFESVTKEVDNTFYAVVIDQAAGVVVELIGMDRFVEWMIYIFNFALDNAGHSWFVDVATYLLDRYESGDYLSIEAMIEIIANERYKIYTNLILVFCEYSHSFAIYLGEKFVGDFEFMLLYIGGEYILYTHEALPFGLDSVRWSYQSNAFAFYVKWGGEDSVVRYWLNLIQKQEPFVPPALPTNNWTNEKGAIGWGNQTQVNEQVWRTSLTGELVHDFSVNPATRCPYVMADIDAHRAANPQLPQGQVLTTEERDEIKLNFINARLALYKSIGMRFEDQNTLAVYVNGEFVMYIEFVIMDYEGDFVRLYLSSDLPFSIGPRGVLLFCTKWEDIIIRVDWNGFFSYRITFL